VLLLIVSRPGLARPLPDDAPTPEVPAPQRAAELRGAVRELEERVADLREKGVAPDLLADVAIFAKALDWALRYPEEQSGEKDAARVDAVRRIGLERATELALGRSPWRERSGRGAGGYRSLIDDSFQPFGIEVPKSRDGTSALRLDVVLHGRDGDLDEVAFLDRFERPAEASRDDRIVLHVFGRTNNAYRWAGETDVFEAIEAVQARWPIDRSRVVLRGFSMGGAGAWHLGLHHPDRWAAVEAGAGFTETERYARLGDLAPHARRALAIYDAVRWSLNAREVPIAGYGGEDDPQLAAARNVRAALEAEGLRFEARGQHASGPFLFLVGPRTGHRFEAEAQRVSDAFLDLHAALGARSRDTVHFVTWTTRYATCEFVRVEKLGRHYERAEIDAERSVAGSRITARTSNIERVVFSPGFPVRELVIDGETLVTQNAPSTVIADRSNGAWRLLDALPPQGREKTPGLQGPIDDAFRDRFIVVRPTAAPWNEGPHAAALAELDRLRREHAKWFRADVIERDDVDVTEEDIASSHLILFGDPGSQGLIERVLPGLPIAWSRERLRIGEHDVDAAEHFPVLIYPNPLHPDRYVVINSGLTFDEAAHRGTNALLYPRLGDWALARTRGNEDGGVRTEFLAAGFFDENWSLAAPEPGFPGKTWTRREPAAVGLDGERLGALADFVGGDGCVVRGGSLVYSWGDPSRPNDVASAVKPWFAHLLFVALEQRRIASLDAAVDAHEPRLGRVAGAEDDAAITWRHLATQTSGYGMREAPGAAFAYNDWQMALFADTLFERVWDVDAANLDERLLRPLLTDRIGCEDAPSLLAFGAGDRRGRLRISPRDFARFGLLYLRGGRWNGEPLLSEASIRTILYSPLPASLPRAGDIAAPMLPGQRTLGSRVIPDNQTDHFGSYSFLWWTNGIDRDGARHWPDAPSDTYGAFGHGGKRACAIIPSLDIVISWNESKIEGRDMENGALARLVAAVRAR
jgi:pimeloyl-ACP methyl ester carboxylesterase